MAGIVQLRNDTPGRACYRHKLQQSKTSMEAMRALRRRLSDAVYRQLVTDAACRAARQASPGEPSVPELPSSAAGPIAPAAPAAATSRRRAGGVNVERPTGRTTLTPTSAGARSTASGPRP